MSVFVRRKKTAVKECDGSGTCGGDGGMSTPSSAMFANAVTNVGGMGNPVPPQENSLGSGDNFGSAVKMISRQAALKTEPRYKLRKKKAQKKK